MINKTLIKINNVTLPNVVNYQIQRTKLWKDSERNMAGDVRASFVGIYPKIALNIGYCTSDEMETLTRLLDTPYFDVTYYDGRTKTTHTAKYYAGDYNIDIYTKTSGKYKPFSVNLIPVSKRSY